MSTMKFVHLRGPDDGHKGLDIQVEVDRKGRVVTLHMVELDAALIESFLEGGSLQELGIRIDDSLFEDILSFPLYRLVVDLAGHHHTASLQYLASGRVSLRLDDPDAESPAFLDRLPADAPLPTRVTMPRAPDD